MPRRNFDMISLELLAGSNSLNSLYVSGSPGCNSVRHAATYSNSCSHGMPVDHMMTIRQWCCNFYMEDS